MGKCPVCGSGLEEPSALTDRRAVVFLCPRCGRYTATDTLLATIAHLRATDATGTAKLSHVLRRAH